VVAFAATCMNIGWNEESAGDREGRPYKKSFLYPPRSCLWDSLRTSNRPFDSNRQYAFPREKAFHIRQAPKTRAAAAVCLPNLCAVAFLQQF
jgi:hypothetical protein